MDTPCFGRKLAYSIQKKKKKNAIENVTSLPLSFISPPNEVACNRSRWVKTVLQACPLCEVEGVGCIVDEMARLSPSCKTKRTASSPCNALKQAAFSTKEFGLPPVICSVSFPKRFPCPSAGVTIPWHPKGLLVCPSLCTQINTSKGAKDNTTPSISIVVRTWP